MAHSGWHARSGWPPHTTLILVAAGKYRARSLRDPRVFDYFDFLTLDDGERRC
jgi:hypothetical protein